MQANYVQRIRLTFSKQGPARFIGHLDIARTLERSLNRAAIPVAYTQGFNRRPRLSIAAALPLGFTSVSELADIWLATEMLASDVKKQMTPAMAPGISVLKAHDVPLSAMSMQSELVSAWYAVHLLDAFAVEDIKDRINKIMAEESILRERSRKKGKDKIYDLRPLIIQLNLAENETGPPAIQMNLQQTAGKTGRPDEVLTVLGFDPLAARIERSKILLKNHN
jgi:radical SAM-linked protein